MNDEDDTIQLTITVQQADALIKLLTLRLSWLADQPQAAPYHVEYQELRALILQMRARIMEKIPRQRQTENWVSVWLYERQRAEFSRKALNVGGAPAASPVYSPTLRAWNMSWVFANVQEAQAFFAWAQEHNEYALSPGPETH